MTKSKSTDLAHFKSLGEMVEFFDTHDMGDYLEQMPEVKFDIDIKRRTYVLALDTDLATRLAEIAKRRQTPSHALIGGWRREKIQEESRRIAGQFVGAGSGVRGAVPVHP